MIAAKLRVCPKPDEEAMAILTLIDGVVRACLYVRPAVANMSNRRTERRHGLGFRCHP